ncbi:MAG TPA: hypothetical protein VK421_11740 [Pyrinomonadaceae bacterium]|nr:hypothetical protein [Pyrinomonadaceae bacterium]
MHSQTPPRRAARARAGSLLTAALVLLAAHATTACARTVQTTQQPPPQQQQQSRPAQTAQPQQATPQQAAGPRTPSATVREFYELLRARRFRDAFAISIWRPAVEGLSADELEDLRPEFDKMAEGVPEQFEVSGEQISGDQATVFVRTPYDPPGKFEEHRLILVGGVWTYGDRESQRAVAQAGRDFFIKARIDRHHEEVIEVLKRIAEAEALYASTHGGVYADLQTLMQNSQLSFREEMRLAETLGYNFRVTLGDGGRSYRINAEPTRYGRTGKLSFNWQDGVLQRKDTGGKPYNPSRKK